ncbi:MAG: hypothetical protein ACKOGN_00720 [Gammaproteobacteria bacterium]
MSQQTTPNSMPNSNFRWRKPMWIAAGGLLLLPAVAMVLGDEVHWGPLDFTLLAALLAALCGAIDVASRYSLSRSYRAGVAVAAIGMFLMVFANIAVGIVGNEDNPLNLIFLLIPVLGIAGSVFTRFRATGMARSLEIMAVVQAGVLLLAWPGAKTVGLLAMAFFVALWLLAARLLRAAA